MEYRRTGAPDRKWIDPFEDAIESINYLKILNRDYKKIDLENLIIIGHSAGGHLAIWLGNNNGLIVEKKLKIKPKLILGLAPIVDLIVSYNINIGENAVEKLLQCTPSEDIYKYMETSPMELLPLKIPTTILHGNNDRHIPIEISKKFLNNSELYNSNLTLIEINKGSHMDFIDPESTSIAVLLDLIDEPK